MTVGDFVSIAMLRVRLGHGPSSLISACDPPEMAVIIGKDRIALAPSHPVHGRLDLACLRASLGEVETQVVTGRPIAFPARPSVPAGWNSVGSIHVRQCSTVILPSDIEEIRP